MPAPELNFSAEEILTTTRSVRKRLDTSRPVERSVIEKCMRIALQAPNGSNRNTWRWIIVDDPALVARIGELYELSFSDYEQVLAQEMGDNYVESSNTRTEKLNQSVLHLKAAMGKMPALLIPLMPGRPDGLHHFRQATMWGSIVQAVWSFFLALRMEGLGSAWTTVGLYREREIAELLDVPFDEYSQVGLFPIAYTLGADFKKGWRAPLEEVMSYNRFES